MTYARKMAIAANGAAKKGNSVIITNGDQYAAIEAVVLEVIERCAKEARTPVDQHGAHGLADEVERRVKRLATQEDR